MHVRRLLVAVGCVLIATAGARATVLMDATTNNGSFETPDAGDPNIADGWTTTFAAARMSSYAGHSAHDGTWFMHQAAGGTGATIYPDKIYNISPGNPVNLTNTIDFSAYYLDPVTDKFQYAQYVVKIEWDEGAGTYNALAYTGWTGIAAATNWTEWAASIDISGLTSGTHAIGDGTDHRLTMVQIRDVKSSSVSGTTYERMWDKVVVTQVPEPVTLVLLGAAVPLLLRRRSKRS